MHAGHITISRLDDLKEYSFSKELSNTKITIDATELPLIKENPKDFLNILAQFEDHTAIHLKLDTIEIDNAWLTIFIDMYAQLLNRHIQISFDENAINLSHLLNKMRHNAANIWFNVVTFTNIDTQTIETLKLCSERNQLLHAYPQHKRLINHYSELANISLMTTKDDGENIDYSAPCAIDNYLEKINLYTEKWPEEEKPSEGMTYNDLSLIVKNGWTQEYSNKEWDKFIKALQQISYENEVTILLNSSGMTTSQVNKIAKLVRDNRFPHSFVLDLQDNDLGSKFDSNTLDLRFVLPANRKYQSVFINLDNNALGTMTGTILHDIAVMVELSNSDKFTLSLKNNMLTDEHLKEIFSGILSKQTYEKEITLDLRENSFTNEGFKSIAASIHEDPHVTNIILEFSSDQLSNPFLKYFNLCCERNKNISDNPAKRNELMHNFFNGEQQDDAEQQLIKQMRDMFSIKTVVTSPSKLMKNSFFQTFQTSHNDQQNNLDKLRI